MKRHIFTIAILILASTHSKAGNKPKSSEPVMGQLPGNLVIYCKTKAFEMEEVDQVFPAYAKDAKDRTKNALGPQKAGDIRSALAQGTTITEFLESALVDIDTRIQAASSAEKVNLDEFQALIKNKTIVENALDLARTLNMNAPYDVLRVVNALKGSIYETEGMEVSDKVLPSGNSGSLEGVGEFPVQLLFGCKVRRKSPFGNPRNYRVMIKNGNAACTPVRESCGDGRCCFYSNQTGKDSFIHNTLSDLFENHFQAEKETAK